VLCAVRRKLTPSFIFHFPFSISSFSIAGLVGLNHYCRKSTLDGSVVFAFPLADLCESFAILCGLRIVA
jgi:hypothetical protein